MSYLSHEKYLELGGTLSNTAFTTFKNMAEKEVDLLTFNRIREEFSSIVPYKEDLELLIFTLINTSHNFGSSLSSCSVDGVSYSYKNPNYKEYSQYRHNLINTALMGYKNIRGIPLLYGGI